MSDQGLRDLIVHGRLEEAVEVCLRHPVVWVTQQLDYETMSEHAEAVSEFFHRWLPALPPFDRLQAADWATVQYILPLVHLEHSYGLAARLYLQAYRGAADEMAQSLRSFAPLTHGPDAEVPTGVADRLSTYAEQLERMDFSVPPGHLDD